ncbi:DUF4270 domain-containing protein [Algibacter pectinivorans]|uniref:DUF4270 domain-containing protein n=1 Tax=Algibacter pectinivorans TaxID=870482 RepID=A0A1I1N7U9_9FLAO|nr:DUF4270 domain-containing protein [Algibacter pectinivorans]SFC93761.1 protein of unknown function [Algibacter pectinivorans]
MKNTFKALKITFFSLLFLTSLVGCEKDFSIIESDVLGEGNANFLTSTDSIPVIAYNKKLNALQVNNLESNLLGVFKDPEYGTTTASIVTQLEPVLEDVDFGLNPVVEQVVINIPYFSTPIGIDDNGNTTYQLDSVYGNTTKPIKLSIYRSNYFLNDTDASGQEITTQNFYSNASSTTNSVFNGRTTINFDDHILEEILSENTFTPSSAATVVITNEGADNETRTYSEPAFRKELDNEFWQNTIVAKSGELELSNENQFKNYFRGLYFKAEPIDDTNDGSMFLVNLESTNATITITYANGEDNARVDNTYTLRFTGNKLNTFINDFETTLVDGDNVNGDTNLYLKGMEGSMAVVDLFGTEDLDGNSIPDNLDTLLKTYRKTDENGDFIKDEDNNYVLKRLINEAHLEIYENDSKVINTLNDNGDEYHKYDRIYAYDIKNNIPTIDYLVDPTESNNALNSKIISLGQRNITSNQEVNYKVRLTEHLNNIIQNDSTNYNIGLVISNNVNYTNNSEILNSSDNITSVPSASIITPRGTILYGSNNTLEENKRLKLKIFFTEIKVN